MGHAVSTRPLPARAPVLVALLPLVAVAVAAWHYELARNIPPDFRLLVGGVALLFGGLAAFAWLGAQRGWRHAEMIPLLAAAIPMAGVAVFAGWQALAAAALLAAAAIALASVLPAARRSGLALALLGGLALLQALIGWLLPLRVHHRGVYLGIALVLVVLRTRTWWPMLRASAVGALRVVRLHPGWVVLLAAVATVSGLGLWLPSLNYDDNAVHLILPSQLLADGVYRFDVLRQSWAVAPWANNVLHAVAALFSGAEARPAMALLWLLLGIAGAWRLARAVGASPVVALAAAAVFAAQPLSGYFTTTMQVDGASAAVLLHLAAIAATPSARRPGAVLVGLLAGLLLALKTSNLVYTAPLLAWLCLSMPAGSRLRWLAVMLAVLLPVAGSSYAYAGLFTGNPLFPFYNAFFKSPYYPLENFRDLKWMAGMNWRTPWDLAFKTDAYGQFYPGAAGIAFLATLPALVIDAIRRPAPRWIAVWAIATACLLFWFMQYLRYIFPALAVLAVLGTVALSRMAGTRAFAAAVLLLVLADALLMPTTSWIARENHWTRLLHEGPDARDAIVRHVMPERALLERVMARQPDACVLMSNPKAPFVGAGRGRAISVHRRYDPEHWRARNQAEADPTGGKWRALLARTGASHVIVDPAREPSLARTLALLGYATVDHEGELQAMAAAQPVCAAASRMSRGQSARLGHRGSPSP